MRSVEVEQIEPGPGDYEYFFQCAAELQHNGKIQVAAASPTPNPSSSEPFRSSSRWSRSRARQLIEIWMLYRICADSRCTALSLSPMSWHEPVFMSWNVKSSRCRLVCSNRQISVLSRYSF